MSKLKKYFYTGLVAILPLVLTIYIFNWIISIVFMVLKKSFITIALNKSLLFFISEQQMDLFLTMLIYLLSLIIMISGITIIGMTLQMVFFVRIVKKLNKVFVKIPLVKQIYVTISQIVEIMASDKNSSYKKAVLVEYPRKGVYSIGLLTSENNYLFKNYIKSEEKLLNVFVPTSPNPTSGMFIIVPESEVKILDIKIDDAIRLIISGGVILPGEEANNKIDVQKNN